MNLDDPLIEAKPITEHNKARNDLPQGISLFRTLGRHQGSVNSLAFDPRGEILACCGSDEYVHLWDLKSGVLLRSIASHQDVVHSLAFNPMTGALASAGTDGTINLWETKSGKLLHKFRGHHGPVASIMFDRHGEILASASQDTTVRVWFAHNGQLLHTLEDHHSAVYSATFDPTGEHLASCSRDGTVNLWDASNGKLLHTFGGSDQAIVSLAFDHMSETLATGGEDKTVKLWDVHDRRLLRSLEGHTGCVEAVVFSPQGHLLASKGTETIRLWRIDTAETFAVIPSAEPVWSPALAFHPTLPLLAASNDSEGTENAQRICLWEINFDLLLHESSLRTKHAHSHHTTGKVVILGDHSVGKSALGHRLIHGTFKEQKSTHGQRFWVFPDLGKRREDGTECEAILWDLAGQPDYRLVHALFVDDADLALVLFDASDIRDPLHGVNFWLKQLEVGEHRCPIILVAAQTDRGSCPLMPDELMTFCEEHNIAGPIHTSALEGNGVAELIEEMKFLLPWEQKPATVTSTTFKRIKDYVLSLKNSDSHHQIIIRLDKLRILLEATDTNWQFSDDEMTTAIGHLENYGYTKAFAPPKAVSAFSSNLNA